MYDVWRIAEVCLQDGEGVHSVLPTGKTNHSSSDSFILLDSAYNMRRGHVRRGRGGSDVETLKAWGYTGGCVSATCLRVGGFNRRKALLTNADFPSALLYMIHSQAKR